MLAGRWQFWPLLVYWHVTPLLLHAALFYYVYTLYIPNLIQSHILSIYMYIFACLYIYDIISIYQYINIFYIFPYFIFLYFDIHIEILGAFLLKLLGLLYAMVFPTGRCSESYPQFFLLCLYSLSPERHGGAAG